MTEQELRAWALAIAAMQNQSKNLGLSTLIKKAEPISYYIENGKEKPVDIEEVKKRFEP